MFSYFSKWDEFSSIDFAILPIGSMEQHGHHLPISTDSIIANALAEGIARHFENSFLLPLVPFSSSFEHAGFPGSVSLKVTTLIAVINDIMESLEMSGIKKCVVVSGHQGNFFLRNFAQETNRYGPRLLQLPTKKAWESAFIKAGISTTISRDMHAGEAETSLIKYIAPEMVKESGIMDMDSPDRPLFEILGIRKYSYTGAIGFPTRGTPEKGKKILDTLVGESEKLIKLFIKEKYNG